MVTKDEIIKLSKLAKLYVSENELDSLTKDMAKIIEFANEISSAETEDDNFDNINGLENVLREDVIENSFDRDLILKNVDGGKDGFFYVKKYK